MPTPRGGRPPAVAPDANAGARLLATADRLFYAEGIRAVGIDRLLAESGVAKASLYQHFGSKDALVGAYLQQRLRSWHGFLDDALPEVEGDAGDRIVAVFELIAAWMRQPGFRGCPFINAAAEFPEADHPAHVAALDHRARNRARFVALATDLGASDPAALAAALVMLYDGALVGADLGSARAAAATLVATVRTLVDTAAPS